MPTTVGYRTFVNSLLLHPQLFQALSAKHKAVHQDSISGTLQEGYPSFTVPHSPLSQLRNTPEKMSLINDMLGLLAEHNKGLMVFWTPQLTPPLIHRGLPLLLSQPEFAESSAALPIMQLLESHGDLMTIFEDVLETGGLHIKIGTELKDTQLYEFSLVAMRFDSSAILKAQNVAGFGKSERKTYGVVSFFGPTRMDYESAIGSISSLVKDLEFQGRH